MYAMNAYASGTETVKPFTPGNRANRIVSYEIFSVLLIAHDSPLVK